MQVIGGFKIFPFHGASVFPAFQSNGCTFPAHPSSASAAESRDATDRRRGRAGQVPCGVSGGRLSDGGVGGGASFEPSTRNAAAGALKGHVLVCRLESEAFDRR